MTNKEIFEKCLEELYEIDDKVLENLDKAEGWLIVSDDEMPIEHGLLDGIYYLNQKLNRVIKLLQEVLDNEQRRI